MHAAWVAVANLPRLRRRIARIQGRAERFGYQLELTDTGERRTEAENMVEALVELRGAPPPLDDWRLVAELRHRPGPTQVRILEAGAVDERSWSASEPRCEHCGLARHRATTYVLRHRSGQTAQVGTSCLRDFTGGRDLLARLETQSAMRSATAVLDELGEPAETFSLIAFLGHVDAIAREAGFVPARGARPGAEPTHAAAAHRLRDGSSLASASRRAAEAIEGWVLTELTDKRDRTDYEDRLVALFRIGTRIAPRRAPLAASAWRAHAAASRRRSQNGHLGRPGHTVEIDVEVLAVRPTQRPSRFGPVTFHRMRDLAGHELAWFAVGTELEPGRSYHVRARVRRHERFRGRARTVLERCRATPLGEG